MSKRWAAQLSEPAFWSRVDFEGANEQHLDDSAVVQIVRRSAGHLLSLDVSDGSCERITGTLCGEPLLAHLARLGLTAQLRSIFSAPRKSVTVTNSDAALQLRAALPSLTRASVHVACPWLEFPGIAAALPLAGRTHVTLRTVSADAAEISSVADARFGFVPFAAAVAEGLARSTVDTVVFATPPIGEEGEDAWDLGGGYGFDYDEMYRLSAAADPAAAERAAAALGAALAHPSHGPRAVSISEFDMHRSARWWERLGGAIPAFPHLCRALTAESPLRAIGTFGYGSLAGNEGSCFINADAVRALAAALAPGRSSLDTLELENFNLRHDEEGCAPCDSNSCISSCSRISGLLIIVC